MPSDLRLADLTTLRLGGPAGDVASPVTEDELVAVVTELDRAGRPLLLVGGGSNLVVADEGFPGTVVRILTRGVAERADDASPDGSADHLVDVAAGEPWDDLVARTVRSGLAGLEAMSGIPGLAGATPVQNVGAYGQEVAQTIEAVRVLDRTSGRVLTLASADCGFGYRTSAFRGSARFLVLGVTFRLRSTGTSTPIGYGELAGALGIPVGGMAALPAVRDAVLRLRRAKGMVLDPTDPDTTSAGSFFTNPVLDEAGAAALPAEAPRYPAGGGRTKTSAAWLIEQAGFGKGYALAAGSGRARISTKHTLALTNAGGATTADLLDLAREIRAGVRARFGIELTPEPVLLGCSL